MRGDSIQQFDTSGGLGDIRGSSPVAALVVCWLAVVWMAAALLIGGSEAVEFYSVAGWFVLFALLFVSIYAQRSGTLFMIPVLLTFEALADFFCVPAWRFINGDDQVDSAYVHAMLLTLIGFSAFWIACLLTLRRTRFRFAPTQPFTSNRVGIWSVVLFTLGFGSKVLAWRLGITAYSYTAVAGSADSPIEVMEIFSTVGNLLNAALVISAIEVFGKRHASPLIRVVFWLSVLFSLIFGIISGMKGEILIPILSLILIYGTTKGGIPRSAFLFPVLPVLIFPFVSAYRLNLSNGYASEISSTAGLFSVLEKSFTDTLSVHASAGEQASSGFDATMNRLSLLADLRDIISLPAPSLLNGDEKIWMAPIYPLVPRQLWKDKPVLDKGKRLSVALGRPMTNSAASTIIGDLYTLYRTWGVVIGMFVYGIFLQIFANWVGSGLSEKKLFIYFAMLPTLLNLEVDTVAKIAGTIQNALIVTVVAYLIYGSHRATISKMRLHSTLETV